MSQPSKDWFNRKRSKEECAASSVNLAKFWIDQSKEASLPSSCSVKGCNNPPTVGRQISNNDVKGDKIIPMCSACSTRLDYFQLKDDAILVDAPKVTAE